MKYIEEFESCLMFQKLELFQVFVHCITECQERAKVLYDNTELKDFDDCEMFFHLVSKLHMWLP